MGKTVKMSFEGKSQQEPRNWQMDRILIVLKKENDPSSAHALGLNTIIFKHVYWYMQQTQVSGYRTIGPLVHIFAQNIDCGYTLKPIRRGGRGGSNEYPQSMFWSKNMKNRYTPAYPSFYCKPFYYLLCLLDILNSK